MSRIACAVITAMACATVQSAWAQEQTLGRSGMNTVFVWKDSAANSEALRLIRAGVHERSPELVTRLLACAVRPGAKAIVLDGGFASSTILVTSGDFKGCRGVVHNEDLQR